ncbi:hypothetical protein CQ060_19990 [Ochrobactrum sp. MYb237]|nr:hypothetical protein [Ochrobactrum sp. MYb237]
MQQMPQRRSTVPPCQSRAAGPLSKHRAIIARCIFSTHYPTHRSRKRNQSGELISLRRRYALMLEML